MAQTRLGRVVGAAVVTGMLALLATNADGQTRFTYSRGQSVSPAFEGWWENDDGTFTMFFGYMNSNWEEELDVPIGPDNQLEPGGPDRGQPTHFYPRRNLFLFTVDVPADFGDQELVWTLTTNGRTERAYGSLRTDYLLDRQTIGTEMGANFGRVRDEWRTNEPPELSLRVDQPRAVPVGQPLRLVTFTSDDGVPTGTYEPPAVEPGQPHPAYRSTQQIVPGNPPGLRFSWMVYRGDASNVTFDPPQLKAWQDTRVYSYSSWSPPYILPDVPEDGRWEVVVIFDAPGTYVLRAIAGDSALTTSENVTITVTQ
ncbi:MAG: hypothetical protein VYE68_09990 [Acidobacteriota bacterium]|nr:hypothetical protein [Acidobacteriota bacterium]